MENNSRRIEVICRPARESDTAAVLALTSQIWEGDDYVPQVWEQWLADQDGRLIVAEHQGQVVGLGKLSRLSDEDWWLQGLRVDPQFEGRGVGSQLHHALVSAWEQIGNGALRLATASFRKPVQHLCQQSGFVKVDEFTPFGADAVPVEASASPAPVRRIRIEALDDAFAFAVSSETLKISKRRVDMGWEWLPLREDFLAAAIREERVWSWRNGAGLLAVFADEEKEGNRELRLHFAACRLEALAGLLADLRLLAGKLGYIRAGWMASLHPGITAALGAAGYQREWDAEMYLYEKQHATRPGKL
jgi:GNAT superfamily N-acetyltransferase